MYLVCMYAQPQTCLSSSAAIYSRQNAANMTRKPWAQFSTAMQAKRKVCMPANC